jgi:hypothetical protein
LRKDADVGASRSGSTTKNKSAGEGNRRASPDVVEKRRAARRFNQIVQGLTGTALDGRTEKRRQRLLRELADGTARGGKRELTPIDVLTRVQALLDLGETPATLRKACKPRWRVEPSAEIVATLKQLHRAYGFSLEVYRFLGLDEPTLRRAGLSGPEATAARRAQGLKPLASARRGTPGKAGQGAA